MGSEIFVKGGNYETSSFVSSIYNRLFNDYNRIVLYIDTDKDRVFFKNILFFNVFVRVNNFLYSIQKEVKNMYLMEDELKKIFNEEELERYYEVSFTEQTWMLLDKITTDGIDVLVRDEELRKKIIDVIEKRMMRLAKLWK